MKQQYKDSSMHFFRKQVDGPPLNSEFIHLDKSTLHRIGQLLKTESRLDVLTEIQQLLDSIRKCEGTPPAFVRNIFLQLTLLVQNATTISNAVKTLSECKRFVTNLENYAFFDDLEKDFLHIINLLFDEIASLDLNPVNMVNEYINRNYADCNLTVEQIATNLFFNTSYLCTFYKQNTGKTINQALRTVRISAACKLLTQSKHNLNAIGPLVGYSNSRHFSQLFFKETGFSPREYRRLHYESYKDPYTQHDLT